MHNKTATDQLLGTLQRHWGYSGFRPHQKEVIESVLRGSDTLAVLPTGTGKSLCYQLPALLMDGTCVVVSPLIALMSDQVASATRRGIRATYINSSLSKAELQSRLSCVESNGYDMVYLAPERLRSPVFREKLSNIQVSFLAVDEAHCISEWGHGFRPSYLSIGRVRAELDVTCLAVTATATPPVRREIKRLLRMRESTEFVGSFDRPNIFLSSRPANDRVNQIAALTRRSRGSGVVYGSTRSQVERVHRALRQRGIRSSFYHGGLTTKERTSAQSSWVNGDTRVIVATNAFGMGIDKPDVRFVFHASMPGSLESYYQEAGRAGRDGKPSLAILFSHPKDARLQEQLAGRVGPDELKNTRRLIDKSQREESFHIELEVIPPAERSLVVDSIRYLARQGVLSFSLEEGSVAGSLTRKSAAKYRFALYRLRRAARLRRSRISTMSAYVSTLGCRRQYVLNYFGTSAAAGCGFCDHCTNTGSEIPNSILANIGVDKSLSGERLPSELTRWLIAEEKVSFEPTRVRPFRLTTNDA